MGLGACGGGIGEDCGEGLAMLLLSDSSLLNDYCVLIFRTALLRMIITNIHCIRKNKLTIYFH